MPRNGPAPRALRAWIACATSSLPEPLSPEMSTVASVGATLSTRSRTACIADERPTIQFAIAISLIPRLQKFVGRDLEKSIQLLLTIGAAWLQQPRTNIAWEHEKFSVSVCPTQYYPPNDFGRPHRVVPQAHTDPRRYPRYTQ